MNEVERGMQGVAEILRARNEEIVRLTTERDHYSAATGERRDAYNRAEEGRIKAVQACIDAEARIAELEAALREAGRNMKLLMECEADERDCKACLARIDALLGDKP